MSFKLGIVEPVVILGLNVDCERLLHDETIWNTRLSPFLLPERYAHVARQVFTYQSCQYFTKIFRILLVQHFEDEKTVVCYSILLLGISREERDLPAHGRAF